MKASVMVAAFACVANCVGGTLSSVLSHTAPTVSVIEGKLLSVWHGELQEKLAVDQIMTRNRVDGTVH